MGINIMPPSLCSEGHNRKGMVLTFFLWLGAVCALLSAIAGLIIMVVGFVDPDIGKAMAIDYDYGAGTTDVAADGYGGDTYPKVDVATDGYDNAYKYTKGYGEDGYGAKSAKPSKAGKLVLSITSAMFMIYKTYKECTEAFYLAGRLDETFTDRCHKCGGTGNVGGKICSKCKGSGTLQHKRPDMQQMMYDTNDTCITDAGLKAVRKKYDNITVWKLVAAIMFLFTLALTNVLPIYDMGLKGGMLGVKVVLFAASLYLMHGVVDHKDYETAESKMHQSPFGNAIHKICMWSTLPVSWTFDKAIKLCSGSGHHEGHDHDDDQKSSLDNENILECDPVSDSSTSDRLSFTELTQDANVSDEFYNTHWNENFILSASGEQVPLLSSLSCIKTAKEEVPENNPTISTRQRGRSTTSIRRLLQLTKTFST